MLKVKGNPETLEEFYEMTLAAHDAKGQKANVQHLVKIRELMEPGDRYRELGTMQGCSAAAAALAGASSLSLIDPNFTPFKPYQDLFDKAPLALWMWECKSSDVPKLNEIMPVEVMLIDSDHRPQVLREELNIYAPKTRKYIVCHDTNSKPQLQKVIENYCTNNLNWRIIEYYKHGVGYTVMENINGTNKSSSDSSTAS